MGLPDDSLPISAPGAIGFFDSGIGGMSVWREVRARVPQADTVYIADTAFAPYGTKTEDVIYRRAELLTDYLIRCGVRMVVIACNTATAVAADRLRAKFDIPIAAVEPPVKPAAKLTRSGTIGVLATERTLACNRFMSLVERHAGGVKVLTSPCQDWVALVEARETDTPRARKAVERAVRPLIDAGADTLVLGCTHYPFLLPLIQEVVGADVAVLNPCPAVADHVAALLAVETPLEGSGRSLMFATERQEAEHV